MHLNYFGSRRSGIIDNAKAGVLMMHQSKALGFGFGQQP
jgi:hypothetical protein